MTIEWEFFFHYALLAFLCLVGFHGLFFHENLLKKVLSLALFQSGVILLLLSLADVRQKAGISPAELNPLGHAWALLLVFSFVGITLALLVFCAAFYRKYGSLEPAEIDKRNPL